MSDYKIRKYKYDKYKVVGNTTTSNKCSVREYDYGTLQALASRLEGRSLERFPIGPAPRPPHIKRKTVHRPPHGCSRTVSITVKDWMNIL